jgi:hypothetical protein
MSVKIEVFATKEGSENWTLLPETSQYLTEKQLVPNVGDAVTLVGKDGRDLEIDVNSFKNIMTVKTKWLNYASADVALRVHYLPF